MGSRKFQAYNRPVSSDDSEFSNLVSKLHLSDEARAAIKAWAKTQPDRPALSEAVRRLVDYGFATD
jgi:hypothetical protein